MIVKNDAEKILQQSQVSGINNVYILGCTDTRVTFNTQQIRAFNLIWALFDQKKITSDSKVAIIGGGLSGMTAAAALKTVKCKTTLYHDKATLMNIQEKSLGRYIHPNVYDWPKAGCEILHTDFPCMNWSAGTANRVFEQIEDRWEDLKSGITLVSSTHIDKIHKSGAKQKVTITSPYSTKNFDCIIIAAGFGIETVYPNTRYGSYWDPDDLDLEVKSTKSKHYLVSGCGDGGLIDALRIRIKNFNHEEFTKSLLQDPELDEVKQKLLQIEANAPKEEEEFGSYIMEQYNELDLPDSLIDNLSKRLRKDTTLELNGRKTTPMIPGACLINRFSIFLLIKLGEISYDDGKIGKVANNGNKYVVEFDKGNKSLEKEYDDVVVRHGPKRIVSELLTNGLSLPEVDEKDKVAHRAWPDGFYPKTLEEINKMTAAYENLPKFRLKVNKTDRDANISIIEKEGQEIYMVTSAKYQDEDFKNSTTFKGTEIKYGPKIEFEMGSAYGSYPKDLASVSLGTKIFSEEGLSGTLGCFVHTYDQQTAFLSSSHLFRTEKQKNIFLSPKGNNRQLVGSLIRKTNLKATNQKRQKNIVDAALVMLQSGIPYSSYATLPDAREIRVQGIATAKIGDQVYKLGAASGLTRGEVTGIHGSIVIQKDGNEYYFEDAIMVHSHNDSPFAISGDSGAIVFRADGRVLGMLFAMSRNAAVLCPIDDILKEMQCALLIY